MTFYDDKAATINALVAAVEAIEAELGALPAGAYASVRTRLDILEARINNPFAPAPNVLNPFFIGNTGVTIQTGFGDPSILNVLATPGSVYLREDGYASEGLYLFRPDGYWHSIDTTAWVGAGDLSGTASFQTVIGLQGIPISTTAPVQSALPIYDASFSHYSIRQITQDDIASGFTITSFSGGSTVEVGATVTNPVFTASYSTSASSANITNTDSINSPLVLSSPYTSGTVVGSFHHTSVASVTFTLTASAAVTKTSNTAINFLVRSFSGIGGASASSASASGNNATLVGASGTLTGTGSDGGLFGSIVGQNLGPFSPVSQKIYILTPHTGSTHTYKDQNGFTFSMLAPTTFSFTNQQGAVISMDLYESTNLLSSVFSILVVS